MVAGGVRGHGAAVMDDGIGAEDDARSGVGEPAAHDDGDADEQQGSIQSAAVGGGHSGPATSSGRYGDGGDGADDGGDGGLGAPVQR